MILTIPVEYRGGGDYKLFYYERAGWGDLDNTYSVPGGGYQSPGGAPSQQDARRRRASPLLKYIL